MQQKHYILKTLLLLPLIALILSSCEKDIDNSPVVEREFNLTGFTKILAGERFNLTVTKGNDFFIKVKGPVNSVNEMEVYVSDNRLNIGYIKHRNNRPEIDVEITLPALSSIHLSGAATGDVDGFAGSPLTMNAILSGASKLILHGTGENTAIDISGASELSISGVTETVTGNISGAGKLYAYALDADEVDLSLSGGSIGYVKVQSALYVVASGGSKLYYKGNPPFKSIDISGGSQVIQQ